MKKNKVIIHVGDRRVELKLKSLESRVWLLEALVKLMIYLLFWLVGP